MKYLIAIVICLSLSGCPYPNPPSYPLSNETLYDGNGCAFFATVPGEEDSSEDYHLHRAKSQDKNTDSSLCAKYDNTTSPY
jgi:hypothetical protein